MTKDTHALTKWKLATEIYDTPILEHFDNRERLPFLMNDVLYHINDSECMEDAISKQITDLQARKSRFKKRGDELRELIKVAFEKFDIEKLETPNGTISKVTRNASKLVIEDEGSLLTDYPDLYTRSDPKLNRVALKALLESGEKIEGVKLEDMTTIMIRR